MDRIMDLKRFLKKSTLLYFAVGYYRDKQIREAFNSYFKPDPLKKSRKEVRRELRMLKEYWQCPPSHYFLYKLYKKKLSDQQLLDFLPPFYYYNVYWAGRHPGLDKDLYESKIYQHELFTRLNIPSVPVVAIYKDGFLSGPDNKHLSIDSLIKEYLTDEDKALFIKPEYGSGGHGILKLSYQSGQLYLNDKVTEKSNLISRLSGDVNYIFQERFIQSKKMAQINSSSVNTLRICTQERNGKIIIPLCILRMGIKNSFIDNFCSGGLLNIINVNDGSLKEYAQTKELQKKYFEHPDSQYIFKGCRIENWEDIVTIIIGYSHLLREWKDLGWDVAIGEEGFKILEVNVQQGLDHQLAYNGFRQVLKIYPEKIN